MADRCCAVDQFGRMSIRPAHGSSWAPRRKPARLRATYRRTQGIRYFHGCYALGTDQLWGITREHKGAGHTLAALKSIRATRPDGYRLFVILDNLSANKTPKIRRWAYRANVELCLTPTNASWANPIPAIRALAQAPPGKAVHAARRRGYQTGTPRCGVPSDSRASRHDDRRGHAHRS